MRHRGEQFAEITPTSLNGTVRSIGTNVENRLLLVFAPDADSALYRRQQEMLRAAEQGLDVRDLVVISVIRDAVSTEGNPAAPGSAVDLRDAYGLLPHEFRVVLIGKDGGVKLRREKPLAVADLFALIDSMPMRPTGDARAFGMISLTGRDEEMRLRAGSSRIANR